MGPSCITMVTLVANPFLKVYGSAKGIMNIPSTCHACLVQAAEFCSENVASKNWEEDYDSCQTYPHLLPEGVMLLFGKVHKWCHHGS